MSEKRCDGGIPTPVFPQVIRFADRADQPWANGGGRTRVIAVGPDDPMDGPFDWRISVATVDSGPFSTFPGVDRVIVLVDGGPMALTVDGETHALVRFHPRRFAGESVVSSDVLGRCLDFNVMTRRGVCSTDVVVRVGPGRVDVPREGRTFLVSMAESVTVRSGGQAATLQKFDTAPLSSSADVCVEGGEHFAVVRVVYDRS